MYQLKTHTRHLINVFASIFVVVLKIGKHLMEIFYLVIWIYDLIYLAILIYLVEIRGNALVWIYNINIIIYILNTFFLYFKKLYIYFFVKKNSIFYGIL